MIISCLEVEELRQGLSPKLPAFPAHSTSGGLQHGHLTMLVVSAPLLPAGSAHPAVPHFPFSPRSSFPTVCCSYSRRLSCLDPTVTTSQQNSTENVTLPDPLAILGDTWPRAPRSHPRGDSPTLPGAPYLPLCWVLPCSAHLDDHSLCNQVPACSLAPAPTLRSHG